MAKDKNGVIILESDIVLIKQKVVSINQTKDLIYTASGGLFDSRDVEVLPRSEKGVAPNLAEAMKDRPNC